MVPRLIRLLEKTHKESEFFGRPFNVYPELLVYYGLSLANLGKFKEGEVYCEKALNFAHRMNHLSTLGIIDFFYSWLFVVKGDGENIVRHARNSIKYLEEGGFPLVLPTAWYMLGKGYYYLGDFENALTHVQKGLKMQKDLGFLYRRSTLYYGMSMIHLDLGDFKNAQNCAEKALNLAQENHEEYVEGISWTLLGRVLGKKEHAQIDRAEEYILKGIKVLVELKLKPYVSRGYFCLGEFYADMGREEEALEYLKKAEDNFKEMGMDYYMNRTRRILDRL